MVRLAPIGTALVFVIAMVASAAAQIVRWTDEQGNAHYADGPHSVPERYRATAVPLGMRNSPAPPPGSEARQRSTGTATIRYSPGSRITVDAKINGRTSVRLLFDTGADKTLISPRVLTDAGVWLIGASSGPIVGVTGQADAQSITIDSLEVQDARVERMHVLSYDMNRPDVDGLLGRDFLDHFNVTLDASTGTITLQPKERAAAARPPSITVWYHDAPDPWTTRPR